MSPPVLIMAGGTGGHVFPALAVAAGLGARSRGGVWLGARRGLRAWLLAPFTLARAVWQARAALHRRRPGVVLGCGGFVSGPGGVAAWLSGTPLVIHEQNSIVGLTNNWLARVAARVAEGFPGTFPAP